ncbi:hypothetical protein ATO6_01330 [Oceanicola sp. 22II-s10i]|nr:hypothetical protein ATO6_01330 [Oceanicola sp. 22II-s10i]
MHQWAQRADWWRSLLGRHRDRKFLAFRVLRGRLGVKGRGVKLEGRSGRAVAGRPVVSGAQAGRDFGLTVMLGAMVRASAIAASMTGGVAAMASRDVRETVAIQLLQNAALIWKGRVAKARGTVIGCMA